MEHHRVDAVDLKLQVDHVVLVLDDPLRIIFEILGLDGSRERHGRQQAGLAFKPQNVLVVVLLVDGLVAREVEGEELLFPVDVALAHRGDPIVVGAARIIAPMIVDDGDGLVVGDHLLPVDDQLAFRLEEILLAVKGAVVTVRERNGNDARIGEIGQFEIVLDGGESGIVNLVLLDRLNGGFVLPALGDQAEVLFVDGVLAGKLRLAVLEVVDIGDVTDFGLRLSNRAV